MKILTLTQFKDKITIKDVEENHTYLSLEDNGYKYGQSYPNTTNTREAMINHFIVFYYPIYCEDMEKVELYNVKLSGFEISLLIVALTAKIREINEGKAIISQSAYNQFCDLLKMLKKKEPKY